MPEATEPLTAASPLAAVWEPGEHGRIGPQGPGVTFTERRDLTLASFQARRAGVEALAGAASENLGLALPGPNDSTAGDGLSLIWVGLDRWLAVAADTNGPALLQRLGEALGETAAVADQSHGEYVLQLEGPQVRDVLMRATPVDVHPTAFPVGRVVSTVMNHTSVQLWRTQAERYLVVVHRGFARDLFKFLTTMSRDVGYRLP
ncbi:sarcosine oxidase subunit gamma [Ferruginivarius sediminum]|uniref:Sarcosine oxidase subunit gamma n=1 Tax=Ferruginivarius sediminum TaxID=2661937 RepID=A0A369T8A1_9PROT|nr:sarcosine oxidase subunit gamma family protein [Ferruginivarius sediminum]RDD61543.1 hypothetical protein DRB17_12675 [Ferruginivarius sediminum]